MFGRQSTAPSTAYGSLLQAATYGNAIPNVYGMTKTRLLMMWAANFRQTGQKGKGGFLGIGSAKIKVYGENVDFLLAANPAVGPMQMWDNTAKLPVNFVSHAFSVTSQSSLTITDSQFYSVIAVTNTISYSETFNDYGNPNGSQSVSGTFEMPLWNSIFQGPDPTNPSEVRWWPFVYRWSPAFGTTIFLDSNQGIGANITGTVTVYYAQKSSAIGHKTPVAYMNMAYEPNLGDGPEYAAAGLSSQQIIYDQYNGLGCSELNMGITGMVDDIRCELQGQMGVYSTGDADFADMIEDIVKSAQIEQASLSGNIPGSSIQRGLSCANYPGLIQQKFFADPAFSSYAAPTFNMANTEGNPLVCYFYATAGTAPSAINDTAGNTWIPIFNVTFAGSGDGFAAAWYCFHNGYAGANTVTVTFSGGHIVQYIYEIGGVDTLDSVALFDGLTGPVAGTITTTNQAGTPSFVLALSGIQDTYVGGAPGDPRWNTQIGPTALGQNKTAAVFAARNSSYPGTYPISLLPSPNESWQLALLSFKCSEPPAYPAMLPNIIDDATMNNARLGARAGGLWGSLTTDTQQKASEYLKNLYSSMNAAPVWSGFVLKSIAKSEQSAVGNGAVFVAPTASGPVANLSTLNGDFISDDKTPPITVKRKAQVDSQPLLQYQIMDRSADYNQTYVSQPSAGATSLYGPRKADPEVHNEIQDPSTALTLLGMAVNRSVLLRNTYQFTITAKYSLLEAMDLITITDPQIGLNALAVRLTSVQEDEKFNLQCEAEEFVYGCNAPTALTASTNTGNQQNIVVTPASVNTPIIFEPVPRLGGSSASGVILWIVVSDADPTYGGCVVCMSSDGGASYPPVGQINGNAITGVTTGDWPAASDPDTTNNLSVDLTESLGSLLSYQTSDENNFIYPCYIAGGNANIPYGIMTYAVETLTAAYKYTLQATGGGNQLRRCVFGAPSAAPGPDTDHPLGSRFAFLGPTSSAAGAGVFAITIDPTLIGKVLHFKFQAFNQFGTGVQDITTCTDYTYTVTGIPGAQQTAGPNNYIQTPPIALTQPTGTSIAMAAVQTQFANSTVNYNARTFTITNPSIPTAYYITIADPGEVGDTGATTNLTATASLTTSLVGVPGNTYIGLIICVPGGGGGATGGTGGWPNPDASFVS